MECPKENSNGNKNNNNNMNNQSNEIEKVVDVVCGMEIDPSKARGVEEYEGKTYYFCSDSCRKNFVDNPKQYISY